MAYFCQKTRKYWHENNAEGETAFATLKKHQMVYIQYRLLEKRLEATDRDLRRPKSEDEKSLLLKRQIILMQLWVYGYLLMAKAGNYDCARHSLTHLELVRQASFFRNHGLTVSKLQAVTLVDRNLGTDVDELGRQEAVLDLMDMVAAKNFEDEVVSALQCALDFLRNTISVRHHRKRVKKNKMLIHRVGTAKLNQRERRAADPWRHGFRRTSPRSEPALRWKGKIKRSRYRFNESCPDV